MMTSPCCNYRDIKQVEGRSLEGEMLSALRTFLVIVFSFLGRLQAMHVLHCLKLCVTLTSFRPGP